MDQPDLLSPHHSNREGATGHVLILILFIFFHSCQQQQLSLKKHLLRARRSPVPGTFQPSMLSEGNSCAHCDGHDL